MYEWVCSQQRLTFLQCSYHGYKSLIFTCCLINEYGHDIPDLLNRTVLHNAQEGTYSMMLSTYGNLIQAIEGQALPVKQAWQRIRNDPHCLHQRKMHEEWVSEPSFKGTYAGL